MKIITAQVESVALVWLLGIHAFVLGIGRLVGAVRLRAIYGKLSGTG